MFDSVLNPIYNDFFQFYSFMWANDKWTCEKVSDGKCGINSNYVFINYNPYVKKDSVMECGEFCSERNDCQYFSYGPADKECKPKSL